MYSVIFVIVSDYVICSHFKIVHRRLAARNVLLNFLLEVKIAGFGPLVGEEGDSDGQAKKRVSYFHFVSKSND